MQSILIYETKLKRSDFYILSIQKKFCRPCNLFYSLTELKWC